MDNKKNTEQIKEDVYLEMIFSNLIAEVSENKFTLLCNSCVSGVFHM